MPGTDGIVQVITTVKQGDVPRDQTSNTYHVNSGSTSLTTANWQALTDAFKTILTGSSTWSTQNSGRGIKIIAYAQSDPKPRPEKAVTTYTPVTWATAALGPREVALCVSMYSGRNLPRQRGRVFLGPFLVTDMAERPSATLMNNCQNFVAALNAAIIALSPSWNLCIYSRTTGAYQGLTNTWVNDEWDTQRRRGLRETTRIHIP